MQDLEQYQHFDFTHIFVISEVKPPPIILFFQKPIHILFGYIVFCKVFFCITDVIVGSQFDGKYAGIEF